MATIQIGMDASQIERSASLVERRFKGIKASAKDVTDQFQILDKNGNLVELRLKGMTQEGIAFSAVIQEINGRMTLVSDKVDAYAKALSAADVRMGQVNTLTKLRLKLIKEEEERVKAQTKALRENIQARAKLTEQGRSSVQSGLTGLRQDTQQEVDQGRTTYFEQLKQNIQERSAATEKLKQQRINAEREVAEFRENQNRQANARDIAEAEAANRTLFDNLKRNIIARNDATVNLDKQRLASETAVQDASRKTARVVIDSAVRSARARGGELKVTERVSKAAKVLGLDASRLEKSYRRLGDGGKKSGNETLISWRSVGRLFVVQALHQSIALLRSSMQEASVEALKYEKIIAEISTITDKANSSTREWAESLRQVGSGTPFKQVELAEAAYQALSNQIISTTDDLGFLRDASDLAVVAASDIDTSVSALSSVLNSFDISLLRTQSVSADLFDTIRLGRTRLTDLEQNLGRVSLLSAQLGVSFKEQQASLATLTIQGVKDNVAKTLLVNVYNKLIRPSKRLEEIFAQWGVTSGQAAVATFGLQGTLQRLFDIAAETGDKTSELGQIFQRIRATIGSFGLDTKIAGENLEKFNKNTDRYIEKLEEITQSTAVKLKTEFTSVNNLMLTLGQTVNSTLLGISDIAGGLDQALIRLTQGIIAVGGALAGAKIARTLISITIQLNTLRAAITGVTLSAKAAAAAWSFGLSIIAGAAGIAVAEWLTSSAFWKQGVERDITSLLESFNKFNDKVGEGRRKALNNWLEDFDELSRAIKRSFADTLSDLSLLIGSLSVDLEKAFDKFTEGTGDFTKSSLDLLSDQLDAVQDKIKETQKLIDDNVREIDKGIREANKIREDLAERDVIKQTRDKAPGVRLRAFEALGTESGLEEALKIAQDFAKDRKQAPDQRAVAAKEALRLEDEITKLKEKQVQDIDIAIKKLETQNQVLENAKIIEQNRVKAQEIARADFEQAVTKFEAFDIEESFALFEKIVASRAGLSPEERAKEVSKRVLNVFDDLTKGLKKAGEDAGLSQKELFEQDIRVQSARKALIRKTQNDISQIRKDALNRQLQDDEDDLESTRRKTEETLAKVRGALDANQSAVTEAVARLRQKIAEVGEPQLGETALQTEQVQTFIASLERVSSLEREIATERKREEPNAFNLNALLKERAEILKNIFTQADTIDEIGLKGSDLLSNGQTVSSVQGFLRDALTEFNEGIQAEGEAVDKLAQLKDTFEDLKEKLIAAGLFNEEIETQKENTRSIDELRKSMERNITAAVNLKDALLARGGILPLQKATGGLVTGPSGIDRIHTMLSAGEFVVNPASTRANLPVLQAINRGGAVSPVNRIVNIGDINITGGPANKDTAKQVVTAIQRGIRQGTIKL